MNSLRKIKICSMKLWQKFILLNFLIYKIFKKLIHKRCTQEWLNLLTLTKMWLWKKNRQLGRWLICKLELSTFKISSRERPRLSKSLSSKMQMFSLRWSSLKKTLSNVRMREQRNTSVVLLVMLGQQQQINLLETRLEKISILMVEMLEVIQTITDLVLETITLVKMES